jgi:hypothetical protein
MTSASFATPEEPSPNPSPNRSPEGEAPAAGTPGNDASDAGNSGTGTATEDDADGSSEGSASGFDVSVSDDASFVETPYGLGTERGRWYHATREMLEAYAREVFAYRSLETLLRRSDQWLDAPRTVALWLLPVLLLTLPPAGAAGATLAAYSAVRLLSPAFPHPAVARGLGWMQKVALQGGYYVFTLSILAAGDAFVALGIGLAAFVLFRWGAVDAALTPALQPVLRRLYPLPLPDQVLRGMIVRTALQHRLELPHLDEMTRDILDAWGPGSNEDDGPRPGS